MVLAESARNRMFVDEAEQIDALLVLSFGGPQGPEDVMPFLERVTSGRNVPRARLEEVAEHYQHFGGVSPINDQNRALIAALEVELRAHGIDLPIYFGNRNWHPFVEDTVRRMERDGIRRALAFVTSAFSSYSGCRQYREDLAKAVEVVGTNAPAFGKVRVFYNHPAFIETVAEHATTTLERIPNSRRRDARLIFTAHSIPSSMAGGCAYEVQLLEASRLVTEAIGWPAFELAFQSRSGPPQVPWLEPDILPVLDRLRAEGARDVVVVPIGFISDHMEVLFDLDTEARERAEALGLELWRVPTVGTHPRFVAMVRELIVERITDRPFRAALGNRGPGHDVCPLNCCLPVAPTPRTA